jgi:hypothetical protein
VGREHALQKERALDAHYGPDVATRNTRTIADDVVPVDQSRSIIRPVHAFSLRRLAKLAVAAAHLMSLNNKELRVSASTQDACLIAISPVLLAGFIETFSLFRISSLISAPPRANKSPPPWD